jgi:hypothetical protein
MEVNPENIITSCIDKREYCINSHCWTDMSEEWLKEGEKEAKRGESRAQGGKKKKEENEEVGSAKRQGSISRPISFLSVAGDDPPPAKAEKGSSARTHQPIWCLLAPPKRVKWNICWLGHSFKGPGVSQKCEQKWGKLTFRIAGPLLKKQPNGRRRKKE